MSEEEYYSRMKKLDYRQMTDRTSRDEDFYIEQQRNYLSKQYIKILEQENKQLKEIVENLTTMTVCGDRKQIKNTAQYKLEQLQKVLTELEEYINKTKLEEFEKVYGKRYGKTFTQAEVIICNIILNKIQELKEKYK